MSSPSRVSVSDRSKWERRYAEGSHDETAPIDLLEEALKWAVGGRAIDVACGRGRHAVALARRGYRVDAVDISPAALASGRARAPDLPIEWRAADLDDAAIEEGAYADLLLVDGNPVRDVSVLADYENNIRLIMKDGEVYKNTLGE